MANLHHLNLDDSKYTDLSIEDNFVYVNHNTHSWLHEIYTYYKKDESVLERLKYYLDKMKQLEGEIK